MNFLKSIFGDENSKKLKSYKKTIEAINAFETTIGALSDDELKAKTPEFRGRLEKGETLDDILPEAFAVVREASKRLSGERHYDVQLIGGIAIHEGNIAEMRTGEGKTLVATLPTYLNALSGKGVHVITVNDYLARRDAVWMGQIYAFLGLSSAVINSQNQSFIYDTTHKQGTEEDQERDESGSYNVVYDFLRPVTRRECYEADITYGTNSEFGFDYLRDNLEYKPSELRQRELNFAVIDEIDSILIDEARTPLIISAAASDSENLYEVFAKIARKLEKDTDYTVDEKDKAIELTDSGIEKAEKSLGVENIYTDKGMKYVHHLETAVRAKALFQKDKEYVVKDGNVVIVDEFTGRLQPTRRWSQGLHQAVEAKEGVTIQQESRTYASITYQNYFRMYPKLAGMTGTAETSSEEFFKVYRIETVVIPTHREVKRIDQQDLIYRTEQGKFKAIARKIKELNEKGQPVLVGTVSIETNELLSNFLTQEGVKHTILNAKKHEQEGGIVANAGVKGAVTIATNMAGRGVDIKLGGVPYDKAKADEVRELGGLYVLGTERHDARRIDNQLRGRSGRQGDPGETQFFVSLEDRLMRVFASDGVRSMMEKLGMPEDQPIQNRIITRSLESAQTKIEGFNFDARKHVLEFDNVINAQRMIIYNIRRDILLGNLEKVEETLHAMMEKQGRDISKICKEKRDLLGDEAYEDILRRIVLQSVDRHWVDHLEDMDFARSSVSLRGYGQRDPLIEYKKEATLLFEQMRAGIAEQIENYITNVGAGAFQAEEQKLREKMRQAQQSSALKGAIRDASVVAAHVASKPKYGRNDMVTIEKDGEKQELKYKKAEPLLEEGWQIV